MLLPFLPLPPPLGQRSSCWARPCSLPCSWHSTRRYCCPPRSAVCTRSWLCGDAGGDGCRCCQAGAKLIGCVIAYSADLAAGKARACRMALELRLSVVALQGILFTLYTVQNHYLNCDNCGAGTAHPCKPSTIFFLIIKKGPQASARRTHRIDNGSCFATVGQFAQVSQTASAMQCD